MIGSPRSLPRSSWLKVLNVFAAFSYAVATLRACELRRSSELFLAPDSRGSASGQEGTCQVFNSGRASGTSPQRPGNAASSITTSSGFLGCAAPLDKRGGLAPPNLSRGFGAPRSALAALIEAA